MKRSTLLRLICAIAVFLLFATAALADAFPFVGFATVSLKMRRQPTEQADVVGTIPAGDAVIVNGESGSYYIVVHAGAQGYALKQYLLPRGSKQLPAITSVPTALPQQQTAYSLLYNGSKGDAVVILQEALAELGFYDGKADGDFGRGTKAAVTAFQQKNGLPANGTADGMTQKLLFEGTPKNANGKAARIKTVSYLPYAEIASGAKGTAVRQMQQQLAKLGYYTGKVDGICGSGTLNAVAKFQKKANLKLTGRADSTTLLLLYAPDAPSALSTPTPKPTSSPSPIPTNAPTPVPAASYPFTTYTIASVNLRKGASTESTRLDTVPNGAEITVHAMQGDYLQISWKGKSGYIMAQYAKVPTQYLPGKDLTGSSEAQGNYPFLQYGTSHAQVALLKDALNELGFYSGAFTDTFDSSLVTSLKRFQEKNGLRQDGIATPEIQQLIFEGKPKNSRGTATALRLLPPIEGYEMKLNDRGEAIITLQKMLASLGHYTGAYTNTFNTATQKAVKDFQKSHTLTVDGVVGRKTWRLLSALASVPKNEPIPTAAPETLNENNVIIMQNGTRGVAVTQLQARLVALEYYDVTPDGIYDSDDIAAVRAFQRKNGLKIDGIAGLETQLLLYSDSALPATTAPLVKPTAAPTLAPTATPAIVATLKEGSRGAAVTALQCRLIELGYLKGTADGIYGSGTARAVTLFQRANGLSADGMAGELTQKKLYSQNVLSVAPAPTAAPTGTTQSGTQAAASSAAPTATLKRGDKGADVKKMQQKLVELQYLNNADGDFGIKTLNAVTAFQRKNGLAADGIAGKMTLNRLFSSAAVAANASSLTPQLPVPAQQQPQSPVSSGFTPPLASQVRYANWFTEIRARARQMPDVVIYDPESGLHFNLHMFSFGKHADSETPTVEDTEILYQINGEGNWSPKYVWVIFSDGRVYIASTHSHGHTVDHTSGNGMDGHICLHFPRIMSEAEDTGPYAVRHQKEILYGWELTQSQIR